MVPAVPTVLVSSEDGHAPHARTPDGAPSSYRQAVSLSSSPGSESGLDVPNFSMSKSLDDSASLYSVEDGEAHHDLAAPIASLPVPRVPLDYSEFLLTHKSQLEQIGLPKTLWHALFRKLRFQTFDAGEHPPLHQFAELRRED
jgi:hypothetical protein